ncbi:protein N-terminal asparagine amidohydrolase-like [Penaeus indicus]|uniref:protein N-terminal asparagine amidohydrolase-like n=1 Tax=Penaeus indicus TaxID=29960 RepID=UPI00300CC5AF
MVLIVGEQLVKEVPSSTSGVYSSWPRLKETAHALTTMLTEEVGPRGLLYLRQREYAVTVPHDENLLILGTDDATTSVMAVLRHTGEYGFLLALPRRLRWPCCLSGVFLRA